MNIPNRLRSISSYKLLILLPAILLLIMFTVKFDIEGDAEGVYILKGNGHYLAEIKDDVLLGEYEKVIFQLDLPALHNFFHHDLQNPVSGPHITSAWNEKYGHGYIQNSSPDGTSFIICFSRFHDSNNAIPKGLFIGGGLPYSKYQNETVQLNETGVAYFNGNRWFHIWCNANEAISGGATPDNLIFPSSWEYLGSKVHYSTPKKVMIQSSHKVVLDGVPAQIDRFIIYRAGDSYFILVNRLKNIGNRPTSYYFVYGDEPWVGDYGTSGGNVGWTEDRIYNFESIVNPFKNSYAGMFDRGNPYAVGERGPHTGMANFIEWIGDIKPDLVYFSNKEGKVSQESEKIPLASFDNRVVFLQWGQRTLSPEKSESIVMAIGMASPGNSSNLPQKPNVNIDWSDINFIMKTP